MASMNNRLNIEKLDENIVQRHGGSKQVGFKQLGLGVKTGVHGVHDEKRIWFEVELQGAQGIVKLRSTQQCVKSGVAKHLGVVGIQQQNGLVDETNVTLFAKVVLYKNMGFNESGEYKKTFIGFGVATGAMQVLQGVEFEVEPQEDHTFEVEPHGNVDHWKSGLKDDMDAWSDVYVLNNSCMKCSDNSNGYYWGYTPDKAKGNVLGLEIVKDQSGYTLSVSQFRFYNGKLVQTLLEGHSILSLEGSLSGDCDVEKNGIATGCLDEGGTWTQVTTLLGVAECWYRLI
nr:zinc finger, CCHC-type [Tanacetum cinerariifolium]